MKKYLFTCAWALLSAGLLYRGATVKAPQIEEDIRSRTAAVIAPQNTEAEVLVDGRFVTLRGMAANVELKAKQLGIADDVYGALGPTDALWIPAVRKVSHYLTVEKTADGSAILSGIVPTEAVSEQIAAAVAGSFKGAISNKLEVSGAADQKDLPDTADALAALASLDSGAVTLAPAGVTLAGIAGSAPVAASAAGLEARTDAPWRVFVNSPAAVQPPSVTIVRTPDGMVEASGVIASEATRGKVLEALKVGKADVIDRLTVRPQGLAADWDAATLAGAAAVSGLEWGSMSRSTNGNSLRGAGAANDLAPISQKLGQGWVTSLAPRAKDRTADDIAKQESEARALAAKLAEAEAALAAMKAQPEKVPADNGDLSAALAARDAAAGRAKDLEAELAALNAAQKKSAARIAELEAVPAAAPAVAALAAPAAPKPAAAPAAPKVSANDCRRSIGALMRGRKITFDSDSARIAKPSMALIDQLARAARPCVQSGSLALIIGGHTDSQGRPTDNLALSRDRAGAVRRAFIDRGLAADAMFARGFGETSPAAGNNTERGRQANRRIVFAWVKKR